MRHGEAVHAGVWNGGDKTRPLTELGEAKVEMAAKEMKRIGFAPALILSSPFERAKHTAELVATAIGSSAQLNDELASGTPLETMRSVVVSHLSVPSLLIIGHMPEIAIFGSRITTEPKIMGDGLEPADMVAIDPGALDQSWGEGRMLWWRKISDWKKLRAS